MKAEMFAELLKSVTQALEHAQGKRELRTTVLPPPLASVTASQVRQLRRKLNVSQAVFARYLNVSTKLVQAWEADRRQPDGPVLVLLHLGRRDPEGFAAAVFGVDAGVVKSAVNNKRLRLGTATRKKRARAA